MRPNTQDTPQTYDIFRSQLTQIINMDHELVSLSQAIDWKYLEEKNGSYYKEEGRSGVAARLMIGLHILKYMFNLSDEGVCERWVYAGYGAFINDALEKTSRRKVFRKFSSRKLALCISFRRPGNEADRTDSG